MGKYLVLFSGIMLFSLVGYSQPKVDKPTLKYLIAQAQPLKPHKTEAVHGTPYFISGWAQGDVLTLEGVRVQGLALKYDTSQDRLLVLCEGDSMVLPAEQIRNFSIKDQNTRYDFERVLGSSQNKEQFKKGYYQVLYVGRVKLLAKAKKKVKKQANQKRYSSKTRYYIYADDREMTGIKPQRKQLLKKLRHRKYELERYIDAYHLKPENAQHLVKIVAYYDSLI